MSEADDKIRALGRRAVAAPGWLWEPGMLAIAEMPMQPERLSDRVRPNWPTEYDWPHDLGLRVPDLSDTTTLALLLGIVRAAYRGTDHVGVFRAFHTGHPYVRLDRDGGVRAFFHGSTIGAALVNALEHAALDTVAP